MLQQLGYRNFRRADAARDKMPDTHARDHDACCYKTARQQNAARERAILPIARGVILRTFFVNGRRGSRKPVSDVDEQEAKYDAHYTQAERARATTGVQVRAEESAVRQWQQ